MPRHCSSNGTPKTNRDIHHNGTRAPPHHSCTLNSDELNTTHTSHNSFMTSNTQHRYRSISKTSCSSVVYCLFRHHLTLSVHSCCVSTIHRSQLFDRENLISWSILLTALAFTPSLIHLFLFPSHTNLLYSLTITAFAFYFFSFQVHEKTVLLPLLPLSLLFCEHPLLSSWVGYVAVFSMFPLLLRDRLEIAYTACQLLYVCIVGGLIGSIPTAQ